MTECERCHKLTGDPHTITYSEWKGQDLYVGLNMCVCEDCAAELSKRVTCWKFKQVKDKEVKE